MIESTFPFQGDLSVRSHLDRDWELLDYHQVCDDDEKRSGGEGSCRYWWVCYRIFWTQKLSTLLWLILWLDSLYEICGITYEKFFIVEIMNDCYWSMQQYGANVTKVLPVLISFGNKFKQLPIIMYLNFQGLGKEGWYITKNLVVEFSLLLALYMTGIKGFQVTARIDYRNILL